MEKYPIQQAESRETESIPFISIMNDFNDSASLQRITPPYASAWLPLHLILKKASFMYRFGDKHGLLIFLDLGAQLVILLTNHEGRKVAINGAITRHAIGA